MNIVNNIFNLNLKIINFFFENDDLSINVQK